MTQSGNTGETTKNNTHPYENLQDLASKSQLPVPGEKPRGWNPPVANPGDEPSSSGVGFLESLGLLGKMDALHESVRYTSRHIMESEQKTWPVG